MTEDLRTRYLRDPLPIRLGGLAADLMRIASWSDNPNNASAVASLLEESKYFAEWAAPTAEWHVQALLAEIQVSLACWQQRCASGTLSPEWRAQAHAWSDRLLELAGFDVS